MLFFFNDHYKVNEGDTKTASINKIALNYPNIRMSCRNKKVLESNIEASSNKHISTSRKLQLLFLLYLFFLFFEAETNGYDKNAREARNRNQPY